MIRNNNHGGNNNNRKSGSGGMKHRHGGGARRYNNNGGGNHSGNRQPDQHNITRQKQHASQMRDKFQGMAQDALRSGERVEAEYFFQHVDHYMRVLADIAVIEAERFAHQREQQQQHQTQDASAEALQNEHGSEAGAAQEMHEGGDAQPLYQHPRRQHRSPRPPRAYDQNASSPNAEAAPAPVAEQQALPVPREIALPASLLPELPTS